MCDECEVYTIYRKDFYSTSAVAKVATATSSSLLHFTLVGVLVLINFALMDNNAGEFEEGVSELKFLKKPEIEDHAQALYQSAVSLGLHFVRKSDRDKVYTQV